MRARVRKPHALSVRKPHELPAASWLAVRKPHARTGRVDRFAARRLRLSVSDPSPRNGGQVRRTTPPFACLVGLPPPYPDANSPRYERPRIRRHLLATGLSKDDAHIGRLEARGREDVIDSLREHGHDGRVSAFAAGTVTAETCRRDAEAEQSGAYPACGALAPLARAHPDVPVAGALRRGQPEASVMTGRALRLVVAAVLSSVTQARGDMRAPAVLGAIRAGHRVAAWLGLVLASWSNQGVQARGRV